MRVNTSPLAAEEFKAALNCRGIDMNVVASTTVRLVTHWQISAEDIETVGRELSNLKRR